MKNEPKYTLDEVGIVPAGLKVVVFDQYGDFGFDSFVIIDPSETSSKGWEVWYTEWEGVEREDVGNVDQGDVQRKLIEIHSDWVTTTQHVHLVCQCLAMGYDVGFHDGKTSIQSSVRFALSALTGKTDVATLFEAAHQEGFMDSEDGTSYGKR